MVLAMLPVSVFCRYSVSGKILSVKTREPVAYAHILLVNRGLWTVSGEHGEFLVRNVLPGEVSIAVSCLGYAGKTFALTVSGDTADVVFYLPEDNLLLDEVVVTAKRRSEETATSYIIDRTGLDHLQMLSVPEAMSLLPGGQTGRDLHLATGSPQRLFIRALSGEQGNPTFGTAIEVDGVRLSNNASFDEGIYGPDTRNIASSNIASIEVVTGVASVEYGDLSNGIVKISTGKGKSPLKVEVATKPNTKQLSLGKGFHLGHDAGVLNVHVERTKSISDPASPYTSYDRNTLSLNYSHTLKGENDRPLSIEAGITGNAGGYNSQKDPDAFLYTYTKEKDNTLRANVRLNRLLHRSWITDLEISGAISYSDNLKAVNTNKSSSVSIAATHGREEGYFVATAYDENPDAAILLIPAGYWYQLQYIDSKPLNMNVKIKARWVREFGAINHHLMLGTEFSSDGNRGKGSYYDDLRYAPDGWREYRYDQTPFMNNTALYAEEKATFRINSASDLQAVAGVRSDVTSVRHSAYGTVTSLSPRFNAKYTFRAGRDRFIEKIILRTGWGKSVKLPSFAALYPQPSYSDMIAFAPGALADGTIFYANHIMPHATKYNPDLAWLHNRQMELGAEVEAKGVRISVTLYRNKTVNPYRLSTEYSPFSYKFTGQAALETSAIPSAVRQYLIDRTTGIVTVRDKTGTLPDETLAYSEKHTFKAGDVFINGSPSVRRGIEWIADFGKIKPLQTSVRMDGNYYRYRGLDENVTAYSPVSQIMADRNYYKYVGFYAGSHSSSNGEETKRLNVNLTLTTHIPVIRMIVSLRVETSLYRSTQRLSEYNGGQRSFLPDSGNDYFPSQTVTGSIYNRDLFTGLYPLYYVSLDDMETKIPFAETFAWARDNDRALYNELARLVLISNSSYFFNEQKITGYYSANISLTKEIGNFASISFNATNFTNNMQLVTASDSGTQSSVYGSSYIPRFYYGLSLRIKV
jgi:outer membrane cobalamin receptor